MALAHPEISSSQPLPRASRRGGLGAVLAAACAVAGCDQVQQISDDVARSSARTAVDEVLVTQFPGIDATRVTPFTDCVIDGASGREITSLASAALTGVDQDTAALVVDIAQRPAVASCFLKAALPT